MVGGHRFIRSVVLGAPLRYFKDLGGGGGRGWRSERSNNNTNNFKIYRAPFPTLIKSALQAIMAKIKQINYNINEK